MRDTRSFENLTVLLSLSAAETGDLAGG